MVKSRSTQRGWLTRVIAAAFAIGGICESACGQSVFAPPAAEEWHGWSADSSGSMPIGNGRVGANVLQEQGTGDVLLLLARTDAVDENARFLKLGRVRVHVEPMGAAGAEEQIQRAVVGEGRLEFRGGGVAFDVVVDEAADVVHVIGRSKRPVRVRVSVENWRTQRRELGNTGGHSEREASWTMHAGGAGGNDPSIHVFESADVLVPTPGAVEWYHRNEESCVPFTLKHQSIEGAAGAFDPLTNKTFGGRVEATGFVADGEWVIRSEREVSAFDVRIATFAAQTRTPAEWSAGVRRVAAASTDGAAAARRATAWWKAFWNRSAVQADGATEAGKLARAYTLQRYVTACQGRGAYPIKFNGGLFNVEPKYAAKLDYNPDWRQWGDSFWWQNTRHMYHPMLACGDAEMTEPLFAMYERVRPVCESRSKVYYGAEGAYFPETMTIFGTYSNGDYGWKRDGLAPGTVLCPWWDDAWNQGPELVAMMLDRWDYTRDSAFLRGRVVPMAESVLRYFDTRFKKDAAGKIVLDPTQVVETYWQNVVNDMPAVAGIRAITERLCALPSGSMSGAQRRFFERMRDASPELPIELERERLSGLTRTRLAPAERYNPRAISNCENGELYAVWPFKLVRLGREELLPEALSAWRNRHNDLAAGWGYDGSVAALLGLTDECVRIQKVKVANSHKAYRWPTTWGPNYDWLPDQNHGGNLLETTNLMLLQGEPLELGGKIRVLPAWPKDWDVKFKLWAPGKTVVECEVRGGRVESLRVTPRERMKDVVMGEGWGGEGAKR